MEKGLGVSELEQPLRETPVAHQCVCLLIKGPTIMDPEAVEVMKRVAANAGISGSLVQNMIENRDKCTRMVDDPDSPFCRDCEASEHHLSQEQHGLRVGQS